MLNYRNPIYNFIRSTHIVSGINHYIANEYLKKKEKAENLTDIALLHIIKSKEELEKHWNNKINFLVIFYENLDILYADMLKNKLEERGIKVIRTSDITQENLNSEKYLYDNHPTEEAWNLLTPLIIKAANLNN